MAGSHQTLKELMDTVDRFRHNHPDVDFNDVHISYERISDYYFTEKGGWETDTIKSYDGPLLPRHFNELHMIRSFTSFFNKNDKGEWVLAVTAHY